MTRPRAARGRTRRLRAVEQIGIGRRQPRLGKSLQPLVGSPSAHAARQPRLAAVADIALVEHRHVDQPEDRLAVVEQGDQRRPARQAADEGAGAVDRVEAPAVAARARLVAKFLAGDAVIGEAFGDRERA